MVKGEQAREMTNSPIRRRRRAVIIFLIGALLFERYTDCQAKGGSVVMWPRSSLTFVTTMSRPLSALSGPTETICSLSAFEAEQI